VPKIAQTEFFFKTIIQIIAKAKINQACQLISDLKANCSITEKIKPIKPAKNPLLKADHV